MKPWQDEKLNRLCEGVRVMIEAMAGDEWISATNVCEGLGIILNSSTAKEANDKIGELLKEQLFKDAMEIITKGQASFNSVCTDDWKAKPENRKMFVNAGVGLMGAMVTGMWDKAAWLSKSMTVLIKCKDEREMLLKAKEETEDYTKVFEPEVQKKEKLGKLGI